MFRIAKRSDDVALAFRREIFPETELAHAGKKRFAILAVTLRARRYATFFPKLQQRLSKGQKCMGGRGEAELAIALQGMPLSQEIEAQAACITERAFEHLSARQHVGKTRDAFETFVRRRDKII